jgi:bis(5'-nucleosyl)-tetraphosphatase (symmetrical)
VALYAIGDIQGCDAELGTLLETLDFAPERDHLWFVGDLVNRGPASLAVLRRVRSLGEAATVTLGNHDLHLLALAHGCSKLKGGDTLADILDAPDRDSLLDWLLHRPLLAEHPSLNLCMVHAGLSPQWDLATARGCAREVEHALTNDPEKLFKHMYGDKPDRWDESLTGRERLRYIVNCFTRLRYVDDRGRLELRAKGSPGKTQRESLVPWFETTDARWRGTRVVFGHWSTLGFFQSPDVVALDTGCVWGGSLTALRLDLVGALPVHVGCKGNAAPGE